MTHPFLLNQENLRAFQQLTAVPTGSVRKWEQLLRWKSGRMQRYLANLVKYDLAEITSCKQHSIFRPKAGVAGCSVVSRSVAVPNQEQLNQEQVPGLKESRFGGSPTTAKAEQPGEQQPGTAELVAVMNRILCKNHPMSYLPVRTDNYGSHTAAHRWLVEFAIPLPDAIELLTAKCGAFNPSKINGDMPRSLGFFTKSVIAKWRWVQRDRQQLRLFPKLDLRIERPDPVGSRMLPKEPEPHTPATPEQLAAFRAEFERAASDPKPQRMK